MILGTQVFTGIILWLADIKKFLSLIGLLVGITFIIFAIILYLIIRKERKNEKAFIEYIAYPTPENERELNLFYGSGKKDLINALSKILAENDNNIKKLERQLIEYENYVEIWAHEIKVPVSLLTMILDNDKDDLPKALRYKLDYSRNKIQNSVSQILFYHRIKGYKKDYILRTFHLKELLEDIIADFKPLLEEKNFRIDIKGVDYQVYSDQKSVEFIIGQVISNSVKYAGEDPLLEISVSKMISEAPVYTNDDSTTGEADSKKEKDTQGIDDSKVPNIYMNKSGEIEKVMLKIKDNGIGVKECDLPYIFEKGFTGDSGNVRTKSSGMGLFLAKSLAKEINIEIEAKSLWGEGFEMDIVL